MEINDIPFVLELNESQRQLLIQILESTPLRGSFAEMKQAVEQLGPIVQQLKGE